MTIEHDEGDAHLSEEDYWAQIKAYNADGSYAYPPPPINADQVFDFWQHVFVPDDVLRMVQQRDEKRHTEMEAQLHELHSTRRLVLKRRPPFYLLQDVWLPPLSPDLIQGELNALAQRRRYRRHPERLEQHPETRALQLAIERTNALVASVPPRRIPAEQVRTAARVGMLIFNAQELRDGERNALWRFTVFFMGERQTIAGIYHTWHPNLIV